VVLDDCNFHDSVQLDSFESERTLVLLPPEGEFVAMNYRTSSEFKPPFRVVAQIEETTPMKARRPAHLVCQGCAC
jgi:AP-4 complex subunit mu-1